LAGGAKGEGTKKGFGGAFSGLKKFLLFVFCFGKLVCFFFLNKNM